MNKKSKSMNIKEKKPPSSQASLELLYNISRELASTFDLRTLLERVVQLSMSNVGAINGSIIVIDDQKQLIDAVLIVGNEVYENTTLQLQATFEHGLAGWVANHLEAALIPDTRQDKRWLQRPDDADTRTGPKSVVSAPLVVGDRLVGVMTLVHPIPGSFNKDHLSLIQAIADQAGIAVLNARLYAESQRKARVMTAVAESAAVITASLQLREVLSRILAQISQALEVEIVSLAMLDPDGTHLEYLVSTATKENKILGLRFKTTQGVPGWVAQHGTGVIIPEAYRDPRFNNEFDRLTGVRTRAIACAPLVTDEKVIGVVEAINPVVGAFDIDALQVLTGIGSLAGTAIRHAQLFDQLMAAHKRYLELFEDSIDPILVTDWEGKILEANRQAEIATGFITGILLGMNIKQLHRLNKKKIGKQFNFLKSEGVVSYESTLVSRQKRKLPIQVYAREVIIDGISHIQWILRDISERKKLDKLREDLISMIYHDLRSPLANVVSSLDVLATITTQESDPEIASLLTIATRSTERIQRLTNSLLDMNRLEAGQPLGNRQPTSPIQIVEEVMDVVYPIAETKGHELSANFPPGLANILVDADMIKRVLTNLLENAIKFSPPRGKI